MINALCIDLDDFYLCLKEYGVNVRNEKIFYREETNKLIEDLNIKNIKCSFFVPGHIFMKDRSLVKLLDQEGHHICSHGLVHRNISKISDNELEYDLAKSKSILEDIVCKEINTFKAPAWSIGHDFKRIYKILIKTGYKFDHSLKPKYFYELNMNLYTPLKFNDLWIIPPTGLKFFRLKYLFCGGFYTKYVPSFILKNIFKKINKKYPFNYFFHPYEFLPNPYNKKIYKYDSLYASLYGNLLGRHKTQFEYLIKFFNFSTLKDTYKNIYDFK